MSGHQGFLQRGLEMAKKATEKDKARSDGSYDKLEDAVLVYEDIIRDYDHAIQQFMAAIKYDDLVRNHKKQSEQK